MKAIFTSRSYVDFVRFMPKLFFRFVVVLEMVLFHDFVFNVFIAGIQESNDFYILILFPATLLLLLTY